MKLSEKITFATLTAVGATGLAVFVLFYLVLFQKGI